MDPTYIFSWQLGKGFKLVADDLDGDIGHFANSIHPSNPFVLQNARFDKKSLKKTKSNKYICNKRVKIDIIASTDIKKDEEIVIDYGIGYWKTMEQFIQSGIKEKSPATQERDARAKQREFYKTK
jgi:SET domain-containing protein